ncbi:MAG: nucleotidyltransferase family protein [Methanocorpusculum sp.]|nr:nucleotidyltransferase family protein [Methanocorpusculum sp.]
MSPPYKSIKEDVLKKLETNLSEIRERFGIETIGIFGSVARGEDTSESDIDILYKFSTKTIRLRQFMGLKEYLEDLFERNVDLIGINWIEPSIRPYIEQDMILFTQEVVAA